MHGMDERAIPLCVRTIEGGPGVSGGVVAIWAHSIGLFLFSFEGLSH